MFKVFKLILNINIERKVCSHHTVQFCETEQKPIRYDMNMAISLKKVLKFALLGDCFSNLFTEVEIWC